MKDTEDDLRGVYIVYAVNRTLRKSWTLEKGVFMEIFGRSFSGVTNVTDNSREVVKGSLFIAIKGANFNGESVAFEMLGRGAVAVISENDLGLGENQIVVPNARLAFAQAASAFYKEPTSKLKLIAVTGTNGKSTVATLVKAIIDSKQGKCGFIGTTGNDTGLGMVSTNLTTPRQDELYRLFAEMVENGVEYCVMETSSQALDQYRIANERFEIGVFTNLTQDHLDWHKTMENYYQAKKRLFTMCKSAIVCIDDEWGTRLASELKSDGEIPVITYSVKPKIGQIADYFAEKIKLNSDSISYWLSCTESEKSHSVKLSMPGLFNVANSIAAFIVCEKACDISGGDCVKALAECTGVRGRCEVIWSGDDYPTVICDYAHTGDALEKILTCINEFKNKAHNNAAKSGKIICVFGAAGERDADKRPEMGEIVARLADELVITSDNPRFEDPEAIIAEVMSGIAKIELKRSKAFVLREKAIEYALSSATKDDIILLAGKGHETYQVIGDEEQPFDEREIVKVFYERTK
ncbi:MAG: UDP-N-acetylmuramoyl-L-alanyl-D-glutamate--2,6-diaminopimelate ligase [Oscillospiraceae bacterium]|nr:UDP-N-acetylmuramoyl-L-alanyl-D-glutamate--2,6-diaminopimelate ligase [Oscillospiraceae bacterium]